MAKKLLVFWMILSLLCGCVSALAGSAKTIYTSDFSKDNDGWYGRGAQSYRTTDATLKTIGRQSSWNSPGRDFDLIEGGKYSLSVDVKQDDLDSAGFMISIALIGMSAPFGANYDSAALGIFVSIICRVREILWIFIGIMLMKVPYKNSLR